MTRALHLDRRGILATVGAALTAGCLGSGRASSFLGVDPTPAERGDDWRMYGRDPGRTRYVPDASLPRDSVSVAWERSTGASSWRPPVIADGTVYCQYANGLFVLDVEAGEGPRPDTHGGFGRGTGPMAFASTEVYRDGTLLVPYGESVGGYAADPDSWTGQVEGLGEGRSRWWIDGDTVSASVPGVSSESPWLASPIVVDGTIVTVHPTSSVVRASDPNDGSSRWRVDLEATVSEEDHLFPHGHVVDTATGTVVLKARFLRDQQIVGEPRLVGIDLADGSLEWTVDEGPTNERTEFAEETDSLAARDGSVYTVDWTDSSRELRILEIDAETGERGWSLSLDRSAHVGIAVDESTLYHVGLEAESGMDPSAIAAVSLEDESVRWERTIDDSPGNVWSPQTPPPTVADEHLLVPGGRGLHALERATGDSLWTFTEVVGTSGGGETERAGLTPAVVSGDRIVLGTTLVLYGLEGGA
ncbi:outer membrane protein assembly factor BamB family protein [Natrialba swarupiae]|uniref:PQQ-binding-like beta-propeller repeat protein n=1 Tax=Natrialba swarupiae TaxID=2448032 RepID=A0A5D5AQR0_9EURY|nr:PQQ-binding-like beta-propeller repeat protein [Natrialba swarupiae]TYT63404.1 PQQ-binding-like beta-propeller repeat protein [Natrialba swarupiae]